MVMVFLSGPGPAGTGRPGDDPKMNRATCGALGGDLGWAGPGPPAHFSAGLNSHRYEPGNGGIPQETIPGASPVRHQGPWRTGTPAVRGHRRFVRGWSSVPKMREARRRFGDERRGRV